MSKIGIKGAHHFGLFVTDAARSLAFYRDALGGTVNHSFLTEDGRTIYMVDLGGGAVVELIPYGEGRADVAIGWAHIALEVDDVQAAYDACLAAGCESWKVPTVMDIGKPAHLAYVHGPDGELLEFYKEL